MNFNTQISTKNQEVVLPELSDIDCQIIIKREDLKGNFDLEVDISTAEVDDTKAKDLGFMLQTIGPNIDSQITMKILSEIAILCDIDCDVI